MPVEAEDHLTPELVAERLAWIHNKRDYLISIETVIQQEYEHPSTVVVKFKFLKKAQEIP